MLHIHVPLFHLLSCNSLLHPQVKLERSRIAPIILWSIPAGRGKANWHCVRRPALRITPAHAGKRTRSWRAYGCPWNHPRAGGEKAKEWQTKTEAEGSPPHGRGKVGPVIQLRACAGITPAWAGKRPSHSSERRRPQDHPRVGGEKSRSRPGYKVRLGSPPRGRGKVADGLLAGACPGITPAWAGKSSAPP